MSKKLNKSQSQLNAEAPKLDEVDALTYEKYVLQIANCELEVQRLVGLKQMLQTQLQQLVDNWHKKYNLTAGDNIDLPSRALTRQPKQAAAEVQLDSKAE
jgi:hypothetical protein